MFWSNEVILPSIDLEREGIQCIINRPYVCRDHQTRDRHRTNFCCYGKVYFSPVYSRGSSDVGRIVDDFHDRSRGMRIYVLPHKLKIRFHDEAPDTRIGGRRQCMDRTQVVRLNHWMRNFSSSIGLAPTRSHLWIQNQ